MNGGKDRDGMKKSAIKNYPGAERQMNDGMYDKIQAEMRRQEINKAKIDPKTEKLPKGFTRGKAGLILLDDSDKEK